MVSYVVFCIVLFKYSLYHPPPRFDAILSEKSGRGYSRFYFRGIKASTEERGHNLHLAITKTLANESRVKRSLGTCKKIVAAIVTSWKRRRDMTAAQLQEEPGRKVKQLVSVSFFITKE